MTTAWRRALPKHTKSSMPSIFSRVSSCWLPRRACTLQQVKDTLLAIEAEQGLWPQLATDMDYLRAETEALTPLVGGDIAKKAQAFALKETEKETEKATYQAMEALIHNLNTMHSRAGAQTPFSSINYGTDISPEGRMVMRNVLLATRRGPGPR